MLKLLACASALALAVPAAAQVETDLEADMSADVAADPADATLDAEAQTDADIAARDDMTTQTDPATTAEADPPLDGEKPDEKPMQADATIDAGPDMSAEAAPTAGQAAPMADEATAQAEPVNDPSQVAAFVEQEFANYDGNADGELTVDEFAAWLVPLQAEQGNHTEAELDLWAEGAFAQADTDDSASVSAAEMTAFLNG